MTAQEILAWPLYGNTVRAWLVALGVATGVAVALLIARGLIVRRFDAIARRTSTQFDDAIVDLTRRTKFTFIALVALAAATVFLRLPPRTSRIVEHVAILAVLLQVAVWGNALITFALQSYAARRAATEGGGSSATTIAAFGVVARIILWLIVVLLILDNMGVKVTGLITGLGITGVAVALAVQNILGDLFAALSIVLDKPFVVGDTIHVDAFVGTVEHVGLKTTRVRSLSGEQVIFSNADLLKSRIRNYKRMEERRVMLLLGATYDTPRERLEHLPTIMREAVEAQERTRFDRAHFRGFGPSALEFEMVYYVTVPEYPVFMDIQQAVNLRVLDRMRAEGIDIAFPTQTIVVERKPRAAPSGVNHPTATSREEHGAEAP